MKAIPVTIKDFKKTYKKAVVKHDTIVIDEKLVLIIGGNGSGKTTLLKSIASLLSFEGTIETSMSVTYSEALRGYPRAMRIDTYLEHMVVLCPTATKERKTMLVKLFGLDKDSHKQLGCCSKGMLQKVNLVTTFMQNKELYLLDEPLDNLDTVSKRKVIAYLKLLDARIVCATHDTLPFEVLNPKKVYV